MEDVGKTETRLKAVKLTRMSDDKATMLAELMNDPELMKQAMQINTQFTEDQPDNPPAPDEASPSLYIPFMAYISKDGLYHVGEGQCVDLLGYFDMEGKLHAGDVPLLADRAGGPDKWDAIGRLISHGAFTDLK